MLKILFYEESSEMSRDMTVRIVLNYGSLVRPNEHLAAIFIIIILHMVCL